MPFRSFPIMTSEMSEFPRKSFCIYSNEKEPVKIIFIKNEYPKRKEHI